MDTMRTATGLEVRLYPNVIEFWDNGTKAFAMTPQEYGEVMRWIEARLLLKAGEHMPFAVVSAAPSPSA